MPRGRAKDRDGVFTRKDRPGQFYGSWVDANGRRRKRKLAAHTLQQARALVNAEKARVEKQRTLGYAPPSRETFGALVPRYLQYQKPRLSQRSYERTCGMIENHLRPAFGAVRLGDIRRADIQQYITDRTSRVSPASVTKELNCLKHLLGLAVEWELIPFNPAFKIKAPRVPAGRIRYLQPTELRAVLATCPEWLRPIAALAAFTAMRRSEILNLRWLNVDIQGSRLMLARTKNGDGRIVYLNELATDVIRSQWSESVKVTDRVFPLADDCTPDNISKGFAVVCRRLGIEDFRFHDLRHTAASWLRMQGADFIPLRRCSATKTFAWRCVTSTSVRSFWEPLFVVWMQFSVVRSNCRLRQKDDSSAHQNSQGDVIELRVLASPQRPQSFWTIRPISRRLLI